jgi:hypothetical protein
MLLDTSLDEVISVAGTDERVDFATKQKVFKHFGREFPKSAFLVETFGENALGALMRKYETLYCGVYSWKDVNYAHAIVIHKGDLFDPWDGLNPKWPSDRFIGDAMPIVE